MISKAIQFELSKFKSGQKSKKISEFNLLIRTWWGVGILDLTLCNIQNQRDRLQSLNGIKIFIEDSQLPAYPRVNMTETIQGDLEIAQKDA